MGQRLGPFLGGLFGGLLASGLILLVAAGPRGHPIVLEPLPTAAPLRIHVAGAVARPGVYELPAGSIVAEALAAAGGAAPQAVPDRLNLAEPLRDGQRVFLSGPDEAAPAQSATSAPPADPLTLVDVNTASAPELELLPGIGPSLAEAIVAYRQEQGLFQSIEDLLDVPGIGPSKLEQMRPWITLE